MSALMPLVYQGLVSSGLILLIYLFFRYARPADYMFSATVVIAVLGLLAIVNPILGFGIKPWGAWLLYSIASAVGGFLLITVVGLALYDALRPAGIQPVGPAGLGFMIVAFPYLLTNFVVLVAKLVTNR